MAITSSFHPDDHTHIEPTRYGPGSNAMGALRTLLVDGGGRAPRWLKFCGQLAARPWDVARLPNLRSWSRRTIIVLVMQSVDNSVTVEARRSLAGWTMRSRPGHGAPSPAWIPAAHRAVRLLAEELGGIAGGTWLDLFGIPATAHFIGGCAIGDSPGTGVIDPWHRVYGAGVGTGGAPWVRTSEARERSELAAGGASPQSATTARGKYCVGSFHGVE